MVGHAYPLLGLLALGFVIILIGLAVWCLANLVRRFRAGQVRFALRHLLIVTLIVAHAGSVVAITKGSPGLADQMRQSPGGLSLSVVVLSPVYVFVPIAVLFGFGCYEIAKGRPYYLLAAMLYLLAVWTASL